MCDNPCLVEHHILLSCGNLLGLGFGTLDRVRVSDPEIRQDVILDLRDFLELANRDAVNALHLQGLAQLECDQTQWDVISAHQVMQWNDSAAYL